MIAEPGFDRLLAQRPGGHTQPFVAKTRRPVGWRLGYGQHLGRLVVQAFVSFSARSAVTISSTQALILTMPIGR
jgi:hypothetical protein